MILSYELGILIIPERPVRVPLRTPAAPLRSFPARPLLPRPLPACPLRLACRSDGLCVPPARSPPARSDRLFGPPTCSAASRVFPRVPACSRPRVFSTAKLPIHTPLAPPHSQRPIHSQPTSHPNPPHPTHRSASRSRGSLPRRPTARSAPPACCPSPPRGMMATILKSHFYYHTTCIDIKLYYDYNYTIFPRQGRH